MVSVFELIWSVNHWDVYFVKTLNPQWSAYELYLALEPSITSIYYLGSRYLIYNPLFCGQVHLLAV